MQINTCKMKNAVGKTLLGFAENMFDDAMLLVWHDDTYSLVFSEGDEDSSIIDDQGTIDEHDLYRFEMADLVKAKVNPEIVKHVLEHFDRIRAKEAERQTAERRRRYEELKKEFEG